jgi:hypothetical protein
MLIALDPGKNLGVAWVSEGGELLRHEIISLSALETLELAKATILVGDGTGTQAVQDVLRRRKLEFMVVDEEGTTLEAKPLYFRDHPPKGLMRWLPKGLWAAPDSIDDYAAFAIALRYLRKKNFTNNSFQDFSS